MEKEVDVRDSKEAKLRDLIGCGVGVWKVLRMILSWVIGDASH